MGEREAELTPAEENIVRDDLLCAIELERDPPINQDKLLWQLMAERDKPLSLKEEQYGLREPCRSCFGTGMTKHFNYICKSCSGSGRRNG